MAKFAQGKLNSFLIVKNELRSFAGKGAKKTIIVGVRWRIFFAAIHFEWKLT